VTARDIQKEVNNAFHTDSCAIVCLILTLGILFLLSFFPLIAFFRGIGGLAVQKSVKRNTIDFLNYALILRRSVFRKGCKKYCFEIET
jgi:hypothetical protein